jgi:hypothetical protein
MHHPKAKKKKATLHAKLILQKKQKNKKKTIHD